MNTFFFAVAASFFCASIILNVLISDLVTKILQKVLETPREIKTNEGVIITNVTGDGIKLLNLTKSIGSISFTISVILSGILFIDHVFNSSYSKVTITVSLWFLLLLPAILNLIISFFLIVMARINRSVFKVLTFKHWHG